MQKITALQIRLADFAEAMREFAVLLDVPPGLDMRQMLQWRAVFNTAYAAAYHPWLVVSNLDDQRDALVSINPSAVAAGIIAERERTHGVPHGPANRLAKSVVAVSRPSSDAERDRLHPLGLNLLRTERDGVRLTAARTLSSDKNLRQLSVVRLLVLLRRVLEQQMQWVVFEPNTPALWSDIKFKITALLRQMYLAGAFRGTREEDTFFVRCDAQLNTRRIIDAGQLLVEIGVAPAEPLEFIIVRIARDGDGTLTVEDR